LSGVNARRVVLLGNCSDDASRSFRASQGDHNLLSQAIDGVLEILGAEDGEMRILTLARELIPDDGSPTKSVPREKLVAILDGMNRQ
jgi:hypothetical protein